MSISVSGSREVWLEARSEPWRIMLPCKHHNFTRSVNRETGKHQFRCSKCSETSQVAIDKKTGEEFSPN